MPKEKVNSVLIPDKFAPPLTDRFGQEVKRGDLICYPIRDRNGIEMYIVPAIIRDWDSRQVINEKGELDRTYFVIRVLSIAEGEEEIYFKKTAINENRRMVKLDKEYMVKIREDIRQLCKQSIDN